jgi:hypothetical protein
MIPLPVPLTKCPAILLQAPGNVKKVQIQLPPVTRSHSSPKECARVVSHGFLRQRHHAHTSEPLPLPQPLSSTGDTSDSPDKHHNETSHQKADKSAGQPADQDHEFDIYTRAVFASIVGLYQVCENLWLAQGWTL